MQLNSCVPYDYMTKQADVNYKMRAILMDWLIEVCYIVRICLLSINSIDPFRFWRNAVVPNHEDCWKSSILSSVGLK